MEKRTHLLRDEHSPQTAAETAGGGRGRFLLAALACGGLVAFCLNPELLFWQKVATEMAMPIGLCWFTLSVFWMTAWVCRWGWSTWLLGLLWIFYTLIGSPFVGDHLIGSLEDQFVEMRPLQMERFDVLVILGGGTGSTKTSRAQLIEAGDRVMVAAQMYHAGLVDKIIATGKPMPSIHGDIPSPGEQVTELMVSIGVDPAAIERAGGRTTKEEMQELSKSLPAGKRIGLVTSAWHLPRALRRARAAGLELHPVPANFATGKYRASLMQHIPTYRGFTNSTIALKEYLGMAVGR